MFVQAAHSARLPHRRARPRRGQPAGGPTHHPVPTTSTPPACAAGACRRDAITTEFENVPAIALETLAGMPSSHPAAMPWRSARTARSRRPTSRRLRRALRAACRHHLDRAPARRPSTPACCPASSRPAAWATTAKGQVRVRTAAELAPPGPRSAACPACWSNAAAGSRGVVIVARAPADGSIVNFPLQQNLHRDGILAVTEVPAGVADALSQQQAGQPPATIAESPWATSACCASSSSCCGDGSLVANEMAPRPHNSGHYSIDACDVSQFELQVRHGRPAPLVAPRLHSAAVMLNLLGDLWFRARRGPADARLARRAGCPARICTCTARPRPALGRKMGHLTSPRPRRARARSPCVAPRCWASADLGCLRHAAGWC